MRRHLGTLLLLALVESCGPRRPPPSRLMFASLPVTGNLADAQRAGFSDCFNYTAIDLRCRRHGVMFDGQGPFEAAVDLVGGDGSGGFDQLILWDDGDQESVYKIGDALEKQGWRFCYTDVDNRGDQMIYTRPGGAPVRMSMDLSYWGKRRMRVLPTWSKERQCDPNRTFATRAR